MKKSATTTPYPRPPAKRPGAARSSPATLAGSGLGGGARAAETRKGAGPTPGPLMYDGMPLIYLPLLPAFLPPELKGVARSTIHRWYAYGVGRNGVKLRTIRFGIHRYTTLRWVLDFADQRSGYLDESPSAPAGAGRRRAFAKAERDAQGRGL